MTGEPDGTLRCAGIPSGGNERAQLCGQLDAQQEKPQETYAALDAFISSFPNPGLPNPGLPNPRLPNPGLPAPGNAAQ